WLPLFDFITQQNPLKILIIQGVALYRYNSSAFKNTFTSFYYILQYLLKQLYFELLNKCFYIILQRFTTLLPLFCPFFKTKKPQA
ncbi:hypothetical protein, partial [Streptococcus pneumoniae]